MCKNLFKGLLGGAGETAKPAARPTDVVDPNAGEATILGSDMVEAVTGREGSGRVKLSGAGRRRTGANVAGLSL